MRKQKLTILLCFFLLIPVVVAQDDGLSIDLDVPVGVDLSADQVRLVYEGEAGETISITTEVESDDGLLQDTTLTVLDPLGRVLAFNDDRPNGERAAQIRDLTLPATGAYTLRIDSFSGVAEGEVIVEVVRSDPFAAEVERGEVVIRIDKRLPAGAIYTYELDVQAGDALTITARDLAGGIDPLIYLLDAAGEVLALNDDHGSGTTDLDVLDARIANWVSDDAQMLQVQVLDFLGRGGTVKIEIKQTPLSTTDDQAGS